MRQAVKNIAGSGAALLPQCDYRRAIFILAHMRCGSTALSNILCSRPDISGYGEAHNRYESRIALGRLVVNQARRGEWRPQAAHLFDKILHSRHDRDACPDFFTARAIFILRRPAPAIRSIRKLYQSLGRHDEYASDAEAAEYYAERVSALATLWDRFPPERRIGLTHDEMLRDPEAALARISQRLAIVPPLENCYVSRAASRRGGAGDPLTSAKFTRIEPRPEGDSGPDPRLDIPEPLRRRVEAAYDRLAAILAADTEEAIP